jgi:hypothetical protein
MFNNKIAVAIMIVMQQRAKIMVARTVKNHASPSHFQINDFEKNTMLSPPLTLGLYLKCWAVFAPEETMQRPKTHSSICLSPPALCAKQLVLPDADR